MPRLQACACCARLYAELLDGRCTACHRRREAAQYVANLPEVTKTLTGRPGRPTFSHRRCRLCEMLVPSEQIAPRGSVSARVRGWCDSCREIDRQARQERLRSAPAVKVDNRDISDTGRRCKECQQLKLWDAFDKRSNGVRGRYSICKECRGTVNGKGRAPLSRIDPGGRVCTDCGVFKPWTDYHSNGSTRTGYKTRCKPCTNAIHRRRYACR